MLMKRPTYLCVVSLALVAAGTSQAAAKPKLHEAKFESKQTVLDMPTIRVGAEDGRWVIMKSPGITYRFSYNVKADHPLKYIMVGAGAYPPGLTAPFSRGQIASNGNLQRTAWGDGSFTLPNSQIGEDRATVLAACNALLDRGETTATQHTTYATLPLYAKVTVRSAPAWKGTTEFNRLYGKTMVKVVCEPEPSKIEAAAKPHRVDLVAAQMEHSCPQRTEVRAIIKYRHPATARFRFKVDGELSRLYTIKAREVNGKPNGNAPGGGSYVVEEVAHYQLDPGQHHVRVEMEDGTKSDVLVYKADCPPFKVTSVWLNYQVKAENKGYCPKDVSETLKMKASRPGSAPFEIKAQGGLVVHSGKATFERKGDAYIAIIKRKLALSAFDKDMMATIKNDPAANSGWTRLTVTCLERLDAELTVRDITDSSACPRKGSVKVRLTFSEFKNKVRYRVQCSGNRAWTRTALTKKRRGSEQFGVTEFLNFDVTESEHVNCALKDIYDDNKVIAMAGHEFQCVKPAGLTGANDLAPQAKPAPKRKPKLKRSDKLKIVAPNAKDKSKADHAGKGLKANKEKRKVSNVRKKRKKAKQNR